MKLKNQFIIAFAVLMSSSCTKHFDSINTNPNSSTTSRADWLANSMISDITKSDISTQKSFMQPFMLGKYILWTEFKQGYQYNSLGKTGFSRLTVLRNVAPMLEFAGNDSATYHSYLGLGHFIRAWQFFQTTMQVGDIPYSDAIKGESDRIETPKYDTQKEVFTGILNELDQADQAFANGTTFDGDIIYNGDPTKWRKLVNSFELYVLINLSKKTSDQDLNVVNRFKSIVASRPLMESYADNFALTYINTAGSAYPWANIPLQKNPSTIYTMVSATLVDSLKAHQDRRLFYYTEPAETKIDAGLDSNDYNAYIGVEPSDNYSVTTTAHSNGAFSDVNSRYEDLYNAEPVSLFSYWDVQFILAEGALRGWISGSAENYYEAGIKGSMAFLANYAGNDANSEYIHHMPLTDDYVAQYLSTVKLKGGIEDQLNQIITQKYLAGFLQDCDFNAWYEFRRTGYPKFKMNASTNENTPSDEFPVRWLYPQVELNNNAENYKAAIQSQYGGNDNVNQLMWLLK